MNTNYKVARSAIRSDLKNHSITGSNKTAITFDFRRNKSLGQCKQCGSDYMKYAIGGFCQNCLQHTEFINREQQKNRQKQTYQGGEIK